jgi:hypothetical protein
LSIAKLHSRRISGSSTGGAGRSGTADRVLVVSKTSLILSELDFS